MVVGIHGVAASRVKILDIAETERAATVLVPLEFGDGGLCSVARVEPNDSAASRSSAGLILDLGLLDLADGGEELYQIFVAG